MGQNLRLLGLLWVRPRRAMSGIIDEGSLLFGAAAVLVAWALTGAALYSRVAPAYAPFLPAPAAPAAGHAGDGEPADEYGEEMPVRTVPLLAAGFFAATLTGASILVLALLYAPFTLLLITVFEPIGSFGVAFRRDFGPFLACTFMAWAAARIPVALLALAVPGGPAVAITLWIASLAYFTVLVAVAARVVFGVSPAAAAGAATLGWVAALAQPFLMLLASPFLLYFAYQFHTPPVDSSETIARHALRPRLARAKRWSCYVPLLVHHWPDAGVNP